MIFVSDIKAAVAKHHGLPVDTMVELDGVGTRTRDHVRARQVAMALSTQLTNHSLSRVGFFFGHCHHTTVLHACRKVETLRAGDIGFDAEVDALAKQICDQPTILSPQLAVPKVADEPMTEA